MSVIDRTELKPCPFCASLDQRIETWQVTNGMASHAEHTVLCLNCGAFGPNDLGRSGAIEMWNMRRDVFPGAAPEQP